MLKNIHDLVKQQDMMVSPLNTIVQGRLKTWLASAISQYLLFLNVLSHKAIAADRTLIIISPKNLKCQNVTINRFNLVSKTARVFVFISQSFKPSSNKQLTASVIGIA